MSWNVHQLVDLSLPHRQVAQARGLLWAADGLANEEVARRCEVDSDTVRRWRARFAEKGVSDVGIIGRGRGRKSSFAGGDRGRGAPADPSGAAR